MRVGVSPDSFLGLRQCLGCFGTYMVVVQCCFMGKTRMLNSSKKNSKFFRELFALGRLNCIRMLYMGNGMELIGKHSHLDGKKWGLVASLW